MTHLHWVTTILILKSYAEIKCIVPVPKSHSNPYVSSFWVLQPNSIAPATVIGFDYRLFIVLGHFSLSEYFSMFVDKADLNDSIFFSYLHATLPDHIFPVI